MHKLCTNYTEMRYFCRMSNCLFLVFDLFVFLARHHPSGPGPPHSRGF